MKQRCRLARRSPSLQRRVCGGKFVRCAEGDFNYGVLGVNFGFPSGRGAVIGVGIPMEFPHFLRIEREGGGGSKHTIVHTNDPKFSMELMPDAAAPDKVGKGIIKRVCVPNSWAGDYARYAKFMGAAQEFFWQSFAEPAPKAETLSPATRRFQT